MSMIKIILRYLNLGEKEMNVDYVSNMILLFLLALAIIGKNNSLAVSVGGLLFILLIGQIGGGFQTFSKSILMFLDKYGLELGVIVLMMGVLAPFALGRLNIAAIFHVFKTYKGFIGIIAGIIVAVSAAKGGHLLAIEPTVVTAVIAGTILGITVFKGYPVGPLIGSGIAYFMIYIAEIFIKK